MFIFCFVYRSIFDTLDLQREEITLFICPSYGLPCLYSTVSIAAEKNKWSKQSHLTKGRVAVARGWFNPFASPCLISWRSVTALPRYCDFSIFNMGPSAILDLLCARVDRQHKALGTVYRSTKFGWNRCSSFDNKVLIFVAFGLKMPIHAFKKWFHGYLTP